MSQNNTTRDNLQAAFAGESQANRKYLYFAKIAREKGAEEVARLFEETAAQETFHAFGHLEQLLPPETLTVADMLRMAAEGETYETEHMYPEFAAIAEAELPGAGAAAPMVGKAAKRFAALARVEARHAAKYRDAFAKVQGAAQGLSAQGGER